MHPKGIVPCPKCGDPVMITTGWYLNGYIKTCKACGHEERVDHELSIVDKIALGTVKEGAKAILKRIFGG